MVRVYLSLGSNLGDCYANLASARDMLALKTTIIKESRVIRTDPMYVTDQPEFVNQALIIETEYSPQELLHYIQEIETILGRVRQYQYGPRTIDIDILYFDQEIIDLPGLVVPHPLIAERAFVLEPLLEIAPLFVCPKTRLTVREMYDKLHACNADKSL